MGPRHYLESRPTQQTIRINGRYINAYKLANDKDLNHSYVTRILNGERVPSFTYMQKLTDALGMSVEELLNAIAERRDARTAERRRRHASMLQTAS